MLKFLKILVISLLLPLAVSACGQKGPLYLPGDPGTLRSLTAEEQGQAGEITAVEEEDEEDDNDR